MYNVSYVISYVLLNCSMVILTTPSQARPTMIACMQAFSSTILKLFVVKEFKMYFSLLNVQNNNIN